MRLSTAKPMRQHLRAIARQYLEETRKLHLQPVITSGRSPDSFFHCRDEDGNDFNVAIRTAKNGRLAFRYRSERWKTIEDTQYVLIAAFGDDDPPKLADLYYVESEKVMRALNEAYKALSPSKRRAKRTFPVWISLEEVKSGHRAAGSGVINEAIDHITVPLDEALRRKDTTIEPEAASELPMEEFFALKEAIARRLQIPSANVDISIQIRMP
jgi:hypothetical protein